MFAFVFQQYSKVLTGHTGSVLCLQYDDKVIISGSSDSTVRVWDVETGEMVNTLIHHCEAVLHLSFNFKNGMMVTCSKDRSIAVWDMISPTEINLRRVLVGHRWGLVSTIAQHLSPVVNHKLLCLFSSIIQ